VADQIFDVGNQNTGISSIGFGTDGYIGRCWLCRYHRVDDPLETCPKCREELAA
jgi:hypothetical protein